MAKLTEINTKSFIFNPFSMIEDDWFLITSMYKEQINTMTAASGALGHMFRKNVAYINIRPERIRMNLSTILIFFLYPFLIRQRKTSEFSAISEAFPDVTKIKYKKAD